MLNVFFRRLRYLRYRSVCIRLNLPVHASPAKLPESGQFLYRDTAHQEYGDQAGDLGIVVASLRYVLEDVPGFFPA